MCRAAERSVAWPLSCDTELDREDLHLKKLTGPGGVLLGFIRSLSIQSELHLIDAAELKPSPPHTLPMVSVMNDYSQRQALALCLSGCLGYECCFAQIAVTIV